MKARTLSPSPLIMSSLLRNPCNQRFAFCIGELEDSKGKNVNSPFPTTPYRRQLPFSRSFQSASLLGSLSFPFPSRSLGLGVPGCDSSPSSRHGIQIQGQGRCRGLLAERAMGELVAHRRRLWYGPVAADAGRMLVANAVSLSSRLPERARRRRVAALPQDRAERVVRIPGGVVPLGVRDDRRPIPRKILLHGLHCHNFRYIKRGWCRREGVEE